MPALNFNANDIEPAAPVSDRVWNDYQSAIFDAISTTKDHLVVVARAGTGKTTTILEALNYIDPTERVILCAFNKRIQTELQDKAPSHVDVKTLHSVGFAAVRKAMRVRVDGDKLKKIAKKIVVTEENRTDWSLLGKVLRLAGLAKNKLATDDQAYMADIAIDHNIADDDHANPEKLARLATKVIDMGLEDLSTIDFDDMIWLPWKLNLKPNNYSVVFVDEAQDLSASQRWLVEQMLGRYGRIVAVGDDRQAIYRFRGAGSGVLSSITKQFSASQLPLSITYRCPKGVVEIAQKIVPDYVAHDSAPDGIVENVGAEKVLDAKPGDFILSRLNAPLVSICLRLLANGVPAVIAGRDIGRNLIKLIDKSKSTTIEGLFSWLDNFREKESRRLLPDHDDQFASVCDRIECIHAMAEGRDSVKEIVDHIDRLFADNDPRTKVVLSSVHKAKGLERPNVWLLADTFNVGAGTEEDNIYYVAVTRAQAALYFVGGE